MLDVRQQQPIPVELHELVFDVLRLAWLAPGLPVDDGVLLRRIVRVQSAVEHRIEFAVDVDVTELGNRHDNLAFRPRRATLRPRRFGESTLPYGELSFLRRQCVGFHFQFGQIVQQGFAGHRLAAGAGRTGFDAAGIVCADAVCIY